MIDLHCHILPGIDDGPRTITESIAIARAANATGTSTIVATPHVSWRYPNDSSTIARLTTELNERLSAEGISVHIGQGAEIAMGRATELQPQELLRLRLGEGQWLLLEPPFSPSIAGFSAVVADLHRQGYRIVLAHPERCPAFHREPTTLHELLHGGVLTSITAGSLAGRFGGRVRRFAMSMFDQGLVHNVASDAHDCYGRPPGMAEAIARAGFGELTEWLTNAVPHAILTGVEVPVRPARTELPQTSQVRRRWWHG